jgi:hypothetical protein
LPGYPTVLEQIDGVLTGTDVEFRGGEFRLGITVDDYVAAGEALTVRAEADDHQVLLLARATDPTTGAVLATARLDNLGEGRYETSLNGLPPGGYEIQVGHPQPGGHLTNVVAAPTVVADPAGEPSVRR